ncbi:MAG TPA: glycosyltransferase [Gemmatimonadaceae bacterium]
MRVLFHISARRWSGSARAFALAAHGLSARRWETTVAAPAGSEVEARLSSDGLEVVPIDPAAGWLRRVFRLRRVLREHFIEVVFVHTPEEHLVAAAATRLAERGGVVRRVPAGAALDLPRAARRGMRLAASGYLFTTEQSRATAPAPPKRAFDHLLAELGVDPTIHDAVEPAGRASLGAPSGTRLVVGITGADARVRAPHALRTIALLAGRHPDIRLALLGHGSDDPHLRMHAAALGITHIVAFLGERDDRTAVLKAADLGWVVAGGDDAAFGYLDLMAARVPVLAARDALAQHYVADGIAGLLLPPDDVAGSAAVIAAILGHEEQRQAIGAAGRQRVAREFPFEAMIDGFEGAAQAARDRSLWLR